MIDILIDVTLLTFLLITCLAIIRLHNLFAVVMLFGMFSLLSAGLFVVLDAADVAFTEAAVGAGISTVLMLTTLALTGQSRQPPAGGHRPILPMLVVLVTGATLIYGTLDIPDFGDPQAPAQQYVAPQYIERAVADTGVPNIVTAVLASYRGFDTMGEVTVIFTAGIGVFLLLTGRGRPRHEHDRDKRT